MIEKFYLDLEFWLVLVTFLSGAIWFLYWLFNRNKTETKDEPVIVEYARSFFPVLLLVVLLRSFVAEPFRIPSGSMMPTLEVGDFILVNKFAYGIRLPVFRTKLLDTGKPKRGDVFVFRYPERPWQNYIKRVIGLPGDTIRWQADKLTINGKPIPHEAYDEYTAVDQRGEKIPSSRLKEDLLGVKHDIILYHTNAPLDGRPMLVDGSHFRTLDNSSVREVVVPEGKYFAMGDNRFGSSDSRSWGFVPAENLVGKAMFVWMHYAGKNDGFGFSRIGTKIK